MIITIWKGVFVVDHPEDKAAVLKRAGFELHEPSLCKQDGRCKACRARIGHRYWSDKVTAATRMRPFCNGTALSAMRNHLDKLAKSRAVTADLIVPAPPGMSFRPFQRAGIAYMLAHKDTLVGDDMGLGKSVEALGFINYLRSQKPQKPFNALVVCPNSLPFNWKNEAEKWLHMPMEIIVPKSSRLAIPSRDNLFVITNYEKLTSQNPLSVSLKRVWDVLVVDEAQALKTPTTARSLAILGRDGLMQRAHRCEFLTGTPLENYPKEIWPIAAAICPAKFGDWKAFAKRYCGLHSEDHNGRFTLVDTGHGNLGELQQRLRSSFMIRRLKGDVLKELPPKRRQLIVLGDSKVDWSRDPAFARWREIYEREYEAKLAAIEAAKTQADYRSAVKNLDTFTGVAFQDMSEFRHKTAVAKLPACIEYIDQVLESGIPKLVIFAHHQDVLAELALHYGPQAVSFHGETSRAAREAAVKRFQEGDARIIIGGLKAAGVGINLFAASTVIFVEIDWNPAIVSQAEDRLCRMGQKKMVHVIHLVLEGTLDVNICKKIVAKQNVIDQALDRLPEHGLKLPAQTTLTLGDLP